MGKRLFTFGCSYTQWFWPTWPDMLNRDNFQEMINYGRCGAGNYYISSTVFDCHATKNITKDDTVIIMWSSPARYDMIVPHGWLLRGNILNKNANHPEYLEEFLNHYDNMNFFHKTAYAIKSTELLLQSIGCDYKFFSAFDLTMGGVTEYDRIEEYKSQPEETIVMYNNFINSKIVTLPMKDWFDENSYEYYKFAEGYDLHPTSIGNYYWAVEYLPELVNTEYDVHGVEEILSYYLYTKPKSSIINYDWKNYMIPRNNLQGVYV
jgi:hypothetical protein